MGHTNSPDNTDAIHIIAAIADEGRSVLNAVSLREELAAQRRAHKADARTINDLRDTLCGVQHFIDKFPCKVETVTCNGGRWPDEPHYGTRKKYNKFGRNGVDPVDDMNWIRETWLQAHERADMLAAKNTDLERQLRNARKKRKKK